jgi:hypothetical protein
MHLSGRQLTPEEAEQFWAEKDAEKAAARDRADKREERIRDLREWADGVSAQAEAKKVEEDAEIHESRLRRARETPARPPAGRPVASKTGSGNLGGASRKEHPGIALYQAALLLQREPRMSDTAIAAAATRSAREYPTLTEDVLADHKWAEGMHRKQVPLLRRALKDHLVRVKGTRILIRSATNKPFRPLAQREWAAIPRAE